jgi:hypothetical protein
VFRVDESRGPQAKGVPHRRGIERAALALPVRRIPEGLSRDGPLRAIGRKSTL